MPRVTSQRTALRLVQGRERILLDRLWDELSADPKGIDDDTRQH